MLIIHDFFYHVRKYHAHSVESISLTRYSLIKFVHAHTPDAFMLMPRTVK